MNLNYTLLADGGSDRSLLPIIDWSVKQHTFVSSFTSQWADLSFLYVPPRSLAARIRKAVEVYPCDLLFIHRDAEGESFDVRVEEIADALTQSGLPVQLNHVPVIPVRMTEAWLLISEKAIREAAGNPAGSMALNLPRLRSIEAQINPKQILFDRLRLASGRSGRRLNRFDVEGARTLISQYVDDFSPLKETRSFQHFQEDLASRLVALRGR